jgi:hypothetical protein
MRSVSLSGYPPRLLHPPKGRLHVAQNIVCGLRGASLHDGAAQPHFLLFDALLSFSDFSIGAISILGLGHKSLHTPSP